jgi:hypothetical protein
MLKAILRLLLLCPSHNARTGEGTTSGQKPCRKPKDFYKAFTSLTSSLRRIDDVAFSVRDRQREGRNEGNVIETLDRIALNVTQK